MKREYLAGTGLLLKLIMRRERFAAPAWMIIIFVIVVGMANTYKKLFSTPALQQSFAKEISSNNTFLAFAGQVYDPSLGGLVFWRVGEFALTLLALMAVFMVIRHTRTDEETGRSEWLGSGSIGRYAPVTATLVFVCGVSVLTGLLNIGGLIMMGLEPIGSIAFGLSMAAIGCFYASVGALSAQLFTNARSAISIASVVLGISYFLRFVGDGSRQDWILWLTPQGWGHQIRPYGDEQWSVLLLFAAATIVVAGSAYYLLLRRDIGSGILATRSGPAHGHQLTSPFALAWRLQRGMFYIWLACFGVMGIALGSLALGLSNSGVSPQIMEFFKRFSLGQSNIINAYFWAILITLGLVAALYTVLATLRVHAEEAAGRAETVLSTRVSRTQLIMSHFLIAQLGAAILLTIGGISIGLTYGIQTGNINHEFTRILIGALIQIPAAWVLGAITLLFFGFLPKITVAISWGIWLLVNVFGEVLGPIMGLNYWLANMISPFHYLPNTIAGAELSILPLLGLLGVTVIMTLIGLLAFRRRAIGA
ncbi:ABC transporter permease [Shimazuella kribbensis]|uniref:ABC transporter permease n=1 Tax=Shimazuella kribbensis TaxID=139808 RepID=UPI0003FB4482|nr:hypothetical protein [Shimazuella kribbensis]